VSLSLEALEDRTALSAFSHGLHATADLSVGQNSLIQDSRILVDPRSDPSGQLTGKAKGAQVGSGGPGYPLPPGTGPKLTGSLVNTQPPAAVFLTSTGVAVTDGVPATLVPTLLSRLTTQAAGALSSGAALPDVAEAAGRVNDLPTSNTPISILNFLAPQSTGISRVDAPAAWLNATASTTGVQQDAIPVVWSREGGFKADYVPADAMLPGDASPAVTPSAGEGTTRHPEVGCQPSQTTAAVPERGDAASPSATRPSQDVGPDAMTPIPWTLATVVNQPPAELFMEEAAPAQTGSMLVSRADEGITPVENRSDWTRWMSFKGLGAVIAFGLMGVSDMNFSRTTPRNKKWLS
jgi:hypothetical protein